MAISDQAAKSVAHAVLQHIDRATIWNVLLDLAKIDGGESYSETLRKIGEQVDKMGPLAELPRSNKHART